MSIATNLDYIHRKLNSGTMVIVTTAQSFSYGDIPSLKGAILPAHGNPPSR